MTVPDVAGRDLPSGWAPDRGQFVFDAAVTSEFERHLSESIPGYRDMRDVVTDVAHRYLTAVAADTPAVLVDLGASRGDAAAPLVRHAQHVTLVETSEPMRAQLDARFGHAPNVHVSDVDLRAEYPLIGGLKATVTLAVLTLQFIPIEHRQRLAHDIYRHTHPDGCAVIVEKCLGVDTRGDAVTRQLHDAHKRRSGHTDDSISRNLLALEGVLVPVTADWNVQLLTAAGFATVQPIWQHANFHAWVAIP